MIFWLHDCILQEQLKGGDCVFKLVSIMPDVLWLNNIFFSDLHSLKNDCKDKMETYAKFSWKHSKCKLLNNYKSWNPTLEI